MLTSHELLLILFFFRPVEFVFYYMLENHSSIIVIFQQVINPQKAQKRSYKHPASIYPIPTMHCNRIFFILTKKYYSVYAKLKHVWYPIRFAILARYDKIFIILKVISYTCRRPSSCSLHINYISWLFHYEYSWIA